MSVHTTLETVSASLHVAAEQVKKLQSISGPSDIVSAVKELTAPLQSIAKEIAQVKKDLESIKDNNLLCLQELKKQTAAAEKHVAVAERQAKLSKDLLRATIQSENGQVLPNTYTKRGVSGMLRIPPSTISEDENFSNGIEGLSTENLKVLAKYYGVSVDETIPKNIYNQYTVNPESELKKRHRDALYNDLNVK